MIIRVKFFGVPICIVFQCDTFNFWPTYKLQNLSKNRLSGKISIFAHSFFVFFYYTAKLRARAEFFNPRFFIFPKVYRTTMIKSNKRTRSFWSGGVLPLTSKRGLILLSDREIASKLSILVEELKKSENLNLNDFNGLHMKNIFKIEIKNKELIEKLSK